MARERMQYQPALDGVRAWSVTAVLMFHGGVSWMSGGYLGVSTFFTLSGFLITSLLLREHSESGHIARSAFYTRRARRLLPASLVCIVGVALMAGAGWFAGVPHIRRDSYGALFQVFNWVKLGAGESYADLTAVNAGLRKPLEHYWSLAIEEQFYWVWPVAFVGLMAFGRRVRRSPVAVIGVLAAVFAVVAPVVARVWGPDAAYWSTPARVSEILLGALAAAWVHQRRSASAPLGARWAHAGTVALVALAVACVLFPTGHGPAYQGALPLVGAASAVLIVSLQVDGPLRRFMAIRPFAALGRVSYGVYLYHWPVFVLIERQHWTAPVGVTLLVKCAITLAVALVSYFVVERPVRQSNWLVPRRTLVAALAATAVVVALVVVAPRSDTSWAVDSGAAAVASLGTDSVAPLQTASTAAVASSAPATVVVISTTSTEPASTTLAIPSRPVRIAVVGDSTADAVGNGLVEWAAAQPAFAKVGVFGAPGCGIDNSGIVSIGSKKVDLAASCEHDVNVTKVQKVLATHPDVVMVITTTWDVVDRQLVKGGPLVSPSDPARQQHLREAFAAYAKGFLDAGVRHVVWVREPVPNAAVAGDQPQTQRARHEVVYEAIDAIAAADPRVTIADLDGWLTSAGLANDTAVRPDGIHIVPPYSAQVAGRFLGPLLVKVAVS